MTEGEDSIILIITMGKLYDRIDERLRAFAERQHIFFVSTAPLAADGHINCSPKGHDTLRIIDPTTVAYLDYVGSGVETIAHLRENGRIVVMLCAFDGPPTIVRFHGSGRVVEPGDATFDELLARFTPSAAVRSIIVVDVERISDSCGYGVPLMRFEKERTQMTAWAERLGEEKLEEYKRRKNDQSIDGLPALSPHGHDR